MQVTKSSHLDDMASSLALSLQVELPWPVTSIDLSFSHIGQNNEQWATFDDLDE